MDTPLPRRRVYQNHSLDSTRWDHYRPRQGDVVVASSYKSGTTWMQYIALRLVAPHVERPVIPAMSPWLESPLKPLDDILEGLDAQPHRRVLKTHMPLDGLPFFRDVFYLVVCRDPRDVFMSLWNHYQNVVLVPYLGAPSHPERNGGPLPPCPQDIHQFWREWTGRGWFTWEREGYPFWANLGHTRTWWQYRHARNILFVHFNDLLNDLTGEIKRVAEFVDAGRDVPLDDIAVAATFRSMKGCAESLLPIRTEMFRGGAQAFLFQGTNGRWRGTLTPAELDVLDEVASRELPAECSAWIRRDP